MSHSPALIDRTERGGELGDQRNGGLDRYGNEAGRNEEAVGRQAEHGLAKAPVRVGADDLGETSAVNASQRAWSAVPGWMTSISDSAATALNPPAPAIRASSPLSSSGTPRGRGRPAHQVGLRRLALERDRRRQVDEQLQPQDLDRQQRLAEAGERGDAG